MINNLDPKEVFTHFEALSQIPRSSGNEKAVSDYILNFAKALNLKAVQDKKNNLIIYKPAAAGYENKPAIMLQAHLDMVCEMNAGTAFDFLNDPLNLYIDGDKIKAKGTTLGADNGIGVAMCMAILESQNHPALEIVLTTDEEAGMSGASNLDASLLKSKKMINLDSGDENEFVMGCAAGTMAEYFLPAVWEENNLPAYSIEVKGLKGGHSGTEITEDRANSLRILGQSLEAITSVKIASVSGGMKINAIPREASAIIAIPPDTVDKAQEAIKNLCKEYKKQYPSENIEITLKSINKAEKTICANDAEKLIASLLLIPIGVMSMSRDIEGLPNASCNMGVLETLENGIKISIMPRGADKFYNRQTEAAIRALANLTGAALNFSQRSPAWPYNPNSELLKSAQKSYKEIFNKEPIITATHGGLECGIFIDKIPELDIISIGPTMKDIHTPDEEVSITSIGNVWHFLKKLLES